ncbi:hypothetical protein L0F63_004344, partial [Massospora cicadina]
LVTIYLGILSVCLSKSCPFLAAQALPHCPTLVTLHQPIWACPSESIPLLGWLWHLPRCTPLGLVAMQLTTGSQLARFPLVPHKEEA